jgi:hypothetical protein
MRDYRRRSPGGSPVAAHVGPCGDGADGLAVTAKPEKDGLLRPSWKGGWAVCSVTRTWQSARQ